TCGASPSSTACGESPAIAPPPAPRLGPATWSPPAARPSRKKRTAPPARRRPPGHGAPPGPAARCHDPMRPSTRPPARHAFDLLLLGGGITGAGVALDAALRGLRVGLIDKGDFAAGTSSASSKLVHGGLRYLELGDVRLVREALRERGRLLRNAPHLVRPL